MKKIIIAVLVLLSFGAKAQVVTMYDSSGYIIFYNPVTNTKFQLTSINTIGTSAGGGSMTYPGAGIALSTGSAWGTSITDNSTNWNTAYTDRLKWDGGSTGLTAATGRASLGLVIGTDVLAPNGSAASLTSFPTLNQNTTGSAATLTTTRTIWGQNFNGSANVTGDITLGTGNITMTGSIGATGARATKGWFTDGEFTNMPTVGGVSLVTPSNLGTGSSITTKYLRGDGTWQTLAGGGDALTSNPLSQFASTTSAQLAGVMSDETGTDKLVYNTSPTLVTPVLGVASATNISYGWTSTATSAGTLTLTVSSTHNQELTGTTTHTVVLPDATTLVVGKAYHIDNNSTGAVTVQTNGGATLIVMGGLTDLNVTATDISTSAGTWDMDYSGRGGINAADMYSVVGSDFTLSAASGVQSAFPTTGDVWTLAASTLYEVEGNYIMTTGTTSHTTAIAFALAGGASVNYVALNVLGFNAVPGTTATAQGTVQMTGVASTVITAAATTAGHGIYFKGVISMNAGGTLTPQINFSANPAGTNLMKAGSFIRFRRLGVNTFTIIGTVN